MATNIDVELHEVASMAGSAHSVWVTVAFADFADLKASYPALSELEAALDEEAPPAGVLVKPVNAGAQAFEQEIESVLVDEIPGVEGAHVWSDFWDEFDTGELDLRAFTYLYVTDPEFVDPAWLNGVADHIQQAIDQAGGGAVAGIYVLPADLKDEDPDDLDIEAVGYTVRDLPGIKEHAANSECVHSGDWVYDVSFTSAIAYPVDEPGGTCAPEQAD